MAGSLSLAEWKNKAVRLAASATKVREQAEHAAGIMIGTIETAGVAAGLAWARGRYPSEVEKTVNGVKVKEKSTDLLIAGLPVSLLVGIAGHLAGFTGALGKYSDHGHAIGTGGLAEYAASMAHKLGSDAAATANKTTPPKTAGAFAVQNRPQAIGWGQPGMGVPAYNQAFAGPIAGAFG